MASRSTAIVVLIVSVAAFTAPDSARADSIHKQIQKHVPEIASYLKGKGVKTVGVLKFRVKKPGEKTTDSAGSINSLLADRLEVAMILGNSFNESQQLQIIKNASDQVAKVEGANHLSEAGRRAMFGARYQLAWGDTSAKADAFLTGVVAVHDDGKNASIGILCFHRSGGKLERACSLFEAELDASTLGEMGESFVLRGAFDGGNSRLSFKNKQQKRENQIREQVVEVRNKAVDFPLVDSNAPVSLEVLYDGKPVKIETRNGRAFVPEPVTGQKVQFALLRNQAARGRLGIVLKVNGENTLHRETNRDLDCTKWILGPQDKRIVIGGYQMDGETAQPFEVLSQSESARRAINYGRNVGLIQLTVFEELTGPPPTTDVVDEDEEDLLAMLRGTQPSETPGSLSALKRQIRLAGKTELNRGLIANDESKRTESKVTQVRYTANPTPIMSATITYYSR
ncbi:MAG: hypothetical protein AB8G99_06955 [Planctomycetaceae bacterium]